ncbi:unnamed protein product [Arctogadus glacialis]
MEDRYSAECDGTEAWLDDHLEFTHSYFIRKASREMVNSWFAERVHTIQPSKDTPPLQRAHHHHQHPSSSTFSDHPPSSTNTNTTITINTTITTSTITPPALSFYDTRCPSPGPNASPAAPSTPTRKISASEFDRPLRPIVVKDSEGSLTFLCSSDRELGAMPTQTTTTTTSVNDDAGSTSCRGEGLSSGGGDVGSDRCRRLLELVREVSSHLDVTALCHKIFLHINELIAADRYSLFLVGEDSSNRKFLVSRLFDVAEGSTLEESSSNSIRLEWNKGIVGHVAATGQPLNIRNAYENTFSSVFHMEYEELSDGLDAPKRECDVSQINYMYAQYVQNTTMPLNITDVTKDLRFPWTSDKPDQPSNHIKSLLCTPIGNGKKDKVIGVCQLVNKMDEATGGVKAFNRNDEQFLEAFAIFCGLGIQNTQMYESVERAMAKQEVTLEVLSYHASAAEEETRLLQVTAAATVPSAQTLHIMDFSFSDFELSDMETTLATIRMFIDLNLVHNYQMKYTSLCHWIMSVKKNYRRNVVYHNWRHAFNTAQCMFAVLKSGRLQNKMRDLEMLALMIAALSHDLDHRGVNNSYIQRSAHPLAHLYCHSTMEHHHFDQCLMILNSPGNQILSGLSLEGYKATLKMIERAILATDLAVYMKRRGEFFELTKNSQFVWEDEDHRDLLRSMLMTACDISAITKPWPVQKRIAELVATEFFEQGDKEREELNIEPIDLMNREKRDKIPSMQVSFIDAICTQLYETLAGMSEHCSPLLDGCQQNRQRWKRLAEQCEKGGVNGLE